jgi:hypothetical protein
MLVYLVYHYGEYGPENLRATLDIAKLEEALVSSLDEAECNQEYREKQIERLRELTAEPLEVGQHDFNEMAWGGYVLEIVELMGGSIELPKPKDVCPTCKATDKLHKVSCPQYFAGR